MSNSIKLCVVAAALLGVACPPLSGQSTDPTGDRFDDAVVIQPGDVLRINVWPEERLGGEFPVEESGYAYLPILGEIRAGGISLDRLREELRRGYGQAMQNPVVTVTPVFRVSVLGAVPRPGMYYVDPTHTLLDIVTLAGGFRGDANETRLRVLRGGQVLEVDARRALATGEAAAAVRIQSGDRIVVPQRRRLTRETIQPYLMVLQTALLITNLIARWR